MKRAKLNDMASTAVRKRSGGRGGQAWQHVALETATGR